MRDVVASFDKVVLKDREKIEMKLEQLRKNKGGSSVLESLNKEIEVKYASMVPTQEDNEKLHLIY